AGRAVQAAPDDDMTRSVCPALDVVAQILNHRHGSRHELAGLFDAVSVALDRMNQMDVGMKQGSEGVRIHLAPGVGEAHDEIGGLLLDLLNGRGIKWLHLHSPIATVIK